MANQNTKLQAQATYTRFPRIQRIEHIVLLVSFATLGLTGLVQKFAGNPVAEWIIGALGGIENVRTLHHIAALVFALQSIYHVILLAHKVYVQRIEMTMLPGLKDVVDAIDAIRFNLGLTKEHPRMPRYNFAEKAEYWALIWGALIMGMTGFMLWNPILVTNILPGQIIPAAKAAHGGEAILAVLAILVWHFYHVHLKTFNKAMFTGRMTRHQMEEEHGDELQQIEAGTARPPADPAAMRRRERVFLPVAVASALLLTLGMIWFLTFESTAITTLPPAGEQAFVPLAPTATPPSTVEEGASLGAPIPHPIEGQEQCDTCHGLNGVRPYPQDHVDRPNESCTICHKPGSPAAATGQAPAGPAPAIPHAVEGRDACDLCHAGAGSLMPLPASHESRNVDTCLVCHQPVGAGQATEAGMPKPIPHSITEATYKDCTVCHGPGKMKPMPENHASFTVDSCTTCHQATSVSATPAAGATGTAATTETATPGAAGAAGPKPIPHSITEPTYKDCTVCHGPGKMKPMPENHASFTIDSCTTCHQPAAATAAPTAGATETPSTTETPAAEATAPAAAAETPTPGGTAAGPKPIPHSITEATYKDCTVCHGPGKMKPMPDDHAGFPIDICTTCHQAAAAGATPAAGLVPDIPHSITKSIYKDCTACHGQDKPVPMPANHASYTVDTCTSCHKVGTETLPGPVPTVQPGLPKPMPHSIVNVIFQDCTACHGVGKPVPYPDNHTIFPVSTCAGCHRPVQPQP